MNRISMNMLSILRFPLCKRNISTQALKVMTMSKNNKYNSRCSCHAYHYHEVMPTMTLPPAKSYTTSEHQNTTNEHIECRDNKVRDILLNDMKVIPDFITEREENSLLQEAVGSVKRLRYEFSHWDNAIHGFRETEKMNWNELNTRILQKVRHLAFAQEDRRLAHVHILDLAKEGYIKPHIDAVRFCGNTIAGISLMSSSVMRLVEESDKDNSGNIFLPQRSLYIMTNRVRYDFTHEVLKDEESFFNGEHIQRNRRISIICRNEPRPEDSS